MPQKKPLKKVAKPAAKKATPVKKQAPASKQAGPKKVKKAVVSAKTKPVSKTAKPVASSLSKAKSLPVKKASQVSKSVKSDKKAAPEKTAPAKQQAKPVVLKHEKQLESMAKTKKQEENADSTVKKAAVKKPEPVKEVKLPKIATKSSVPYQPSYKSLEQRQEPVRNNEPLVRYSDSDLNEFRELIQRKLDAAKKELAYLQGLITRKDDMGGDESENRYMTMEDGSISMEREQLSQMASRQITYIDHLEKAIIRIENKTYGICRVTGRLIDKARLRAVPHATLSLEAKLGLVKAGE
jgi:RNA polymerase-binding transcription factor DksA